MAKVKFSTGFFLGATAFFAVFFGAVLGKILAETKYIRDNENFTEFTTALPTKLLDINGELITEFASEEKREIISIRRMPQQVIDALISREDKNFYRHRGYNVFATARAFLGRLAGKNFGGGSPGRSTATAPTCPTGGRFRSSGGRCRWSGGTRRTRFWSST